MNRTYLLRPGPGTAGVLVQRASLSEAVTPKSAHSSRCFLIASAAAAAGLSSRNYRKCIADEEESPWLA